MTAIEKVQPYNIYRVNPVNLFEQRRSDNQKDYGFFAQQTGYNLGHPKVQGNSTQARNLDFLA
ncbi:MAG: hypothetical protein LBK53_08675 [Heliobacteriaceae bacterium]|jgi:hypothetical protein|nr:hypothetical protein [Heliobacteriaceae bacterium]